jgi:hypothetical protein
VTCVSVTIFLAPQFQLQQAFVPAITLQLMIQDSPDWSYWDSNFTSIAAQLYDQVSDGS